MHEPHNGGQAALQPHSVLGHFALRVPEKYKFVKHKIWTRGLVCFGSGFTDSGSGILGSLTIRIQGFDDQKLERKITRTADPGSTTLAERHTDYYSGV